MRCPVCSSDMQPGRAEISATTAGKVLNVIDMFTGSGGPGSPRYLYFTPDGGEAECAKHDGPAFGCPSCGAILLRNALEQKPQTPPRRPPAPPEPKAEERPRTNCPACKAAIGPQDRRCPGCGIRLL